MENWNAEMTKAYEAGVKGEPYAGDFHACYAQGAGTQRLCAYVPGSTTIVDTLKPDGSTYCYGSTRKELDEKYPGAVLCPFDWACAQIDKAMEEKYLKPPIEIDKKKFWYLLEVLPPVAWTQLDGEEGFFMSEFESGVWTSHIARIGDRYFCATRIAKGKKSVCDFIEECAAMVKKGEHVNKENNMSTHEKAVAAGLEIDHHESDLYLKDCKEARELIAESEFSANARMFQSQIDGSLWWDVPFAYKPFWDRATEGAR